MVAMIAWGTFALVIGLGELRQAQAQEAKGPARQNIYMYEKCLQHISAQ
jgi:hypothetical protein